MKTKVSIMTVVLSILQTSPDQFRVFKSGSLLSIFGSISPFCIHVLYMYWYCWYIGTSHSMSLYQYVTGTALVLLFICTGNVGTVATLVPATLRLCTNMLLVPHWYCCLYVLVLWVLWVHWYQPLHVSVPICYWYRTVTALYMYWYCGYCWYIGTDSMSLYQYVTGTALVLLFICTGTVGTVGTLVPVTLCLCAHMLLVPHWYCSLYVLVLWVLLIHWYQPLFLCTNMLLVLHWYCCLYVLVLWVLLVHWYQSLYVSVIICYWYYTGTALYMYWYCWYTGTSYSISLYQYVTGTALVLLFICTGTVGTVGTLVPATLCLCAYTLLVPHWYWSLYVLVLWVLLVHWYQPLCLCTNMLLVLHWYWSLYVLVLWILLVHWYQPLYVSVPIYYWYCTGTAVYMYWYCGYCWYIATSHFMSLYQYVTGTALVLLFICTGTVGTVGTLVPATLCLCTNMLLVLHWYCCLYVLVLWVLLVHWYQSLCLCTNMLLVLHWYCCLYVLVLWVLLVHWYQPLYVSVPICYWYCTGTGLYMYWYCGYCWYIATSHFMSLYQYVTGTALVLLFICTGTVGTVGTLVPATLCLCTNMLLVLHWYCCLYVLVLWVLLVHWYQSLFVDVV